MSLFETLKKDQLRARVERNAVKSSVLTTLVGELQTAASRDKNTVLTDGDVVNLIRKFIKNNEETFRLSGKQDGLRENEYLINYLPQQLSSSQLNTLIQTIMTNGGYNHKRDLGKILGELKTNYDGRYEAKEVIVLINKILAG